MEAILGIAPFSKKPFNLTLLGITNDDQDLSVDTLSSTTVDLIKQFGVEEINIKINKRGAPPEGGGSVTLQCSPVRQLKPINLINQGKVIRLGFD